LRHNDDTKASELAWASGGLGAGHTMRLRWRLPFGTFPALIRNELPSESVN